MQRVLERKPGTVIDIGANVGLYLLWLKSIDARASYIGDDLLRTLAPNRISFIKIDVEGAELEVLQGLAKTLAEHRPIVLCEIVMVPAGHPAHDEKQSLIASTLAFLDQLDYYVLSVASDNELRRLALPADFGPGQQIDRILVHAEDCDAISDAWPLR